MDRKHGTNERREITENIQDEKEDGRRQGGKP